MPDEPEDRPSRPDLKAVGAAPDQDEADTTVGGDGAADSAGDLAVDAGQEAGGDEASEQRSSDEHASPDDDSSDGASSEDAPDDDGSGGGVNPTAQAAIDLATGAASSMVGVANHLARSRRWMVRDTPNGDRLRTEIARFAAVLPGLVERAPKSSEEWAPTAEALGVGAAEALARGDNLEAWDLLWTGQREAIDGLRPEEVRAAGTATLDAARGLLEPAAVTAAKKELAGVEEASVRDARSKVREARLLVDRLSLDVYRRLHQEARRISAFSMLTVLFLLAGAFATLVGIPAGSDGDALSGASAYLTVVTFGAAGAVISLVLPWREKRPRPALLDFVNAVDLMILRISMGAAFALIFVAVMQAGVQDVVQIDGAQAYPWALAAGFSERLLDRRLEGLDAEARDLDSH